MGQIRRMLQDPSCVFAESLGDLQYLRDNYTVAGNPQPVESPLGKALRLDGTNDHLISKNPASLNFTSEDFSGGGFITPESVSVYQTLFSNHEYQIEGWVFWVLNDGTIQFRTNQGGSSQDTDSTTTVTINKLNHIGFSRTGVTAKLYINGIEVSYDTQDAHSNPVSSAEDFVIGAYANNPTLFKVIGSLIDPFIFNRVVSDQEMLNFATGKAF